MMDEELERNKIGRVWSWFSLMMGACRFLMLFVLLLCVCGVDETLGKSLRLRTCSAPVKLEWYYLPRGVLWRISEIMYIKCLAHNKRAINVSNLGESQDWYCFYCIWSQKDESSSVEGNEVATDSVHCLQWMRKCQLELCGRSAFPFDQGTSLFVFIPLPWFREAIGGKFSSRVTCFKRDKHSFLSLRKSVQLQKSLIPSYVNTQDVITSRNRTER